MRVLVTGGLGMIGSFVVRELLAAGHEAVVLDRHEGPAPLSDVASEEDVVERVMRLTGGRLADVVVDVSAGATRPILDAIEIVRAGGTIVLAGMKEGRTVSGLAPDKLVLKSIRLQGAFAVDSASFREAIRLLEAGSQAYARLHTASFPLAAAEQAIARLEGSDGEAPAIHVSIEPGIKA